MDDFNHDRKPDEHEQKNKLRRTQSERSDPTCYGGGGSTIGNGSVVTGSEIGVPLKGSSISDVGPSASIDRKGIYPIGVPAPPAGRGGNEVRSSILEDWTVEEASVEGLKTKIGRWQTELPPIYDHGSEHHKKTSTNGR